MTASTIARMDAGVGDIDDEAVRFAACAADIFDGRVDHARSRSQTTTFAPSRANFIAVAWPMPRAGAGDDRRLCPAVSCDFLVLGLFGCGAQCSRICGIAQLPQSLSDCGSDSYTMIQLPPRERRREETLRRQPAPHSSASTPPCTVAWWFKRPSANRSITLPHAPVFGSRAP